MLVACAACGKRISDRVPACPFCGSLPDRAPRAAGPHPAERPAARPVAHPRRDPRFRLSAGSVIERTFRFWVADFVVLAALGAVLVVPAVALGGLVTVGGSARPDPLRSVTVLFRSALTLVLEGSVTYAALVRLGGSPATFTAALRAGISRFWAVMWAGTLSGLALLSACLCLIVPGLVLATWFWVVVPAAVAESPARDVLTRSRRLTEGNRWSVFACMAFLGLIRAAGAVAILALVRAAGGPGVFVGSGGLQLTAGAHVIVALLGVPLLTLGAIGPAVAYHDLRVGKEGISSAELLSGL